MNAEFKWTADLLAEFIRDYSDREGTVAELMKLFKESKQPKPDWEIISYLSDTIPDQYVIDISHMNWNYAVVRNYPINSVKRLSDGEVFTIGDKYRNDSGMKEYTIRAFEIRDGVLRANAKEHGFDYFEDLIKIKEPLFISEDACAIYEGGQVALLSTDNWLISFPITAPEKPFKGDKDQFKYFSTKEAAKEYIVNNKPCLSLSDVLNVWNKSVTSSRFQGDLKDFVLKKINL